MSALCRPAIDGWFTDGDTPSLLGRRCTQCGTYHFPPTATWCANPACRGRDLEVVELSRSGTIWSYTDARYAPPPPYHPPPLPSAGSDNEPSSVESAAEHRPFAIAAVELQQERLIVLGQVASGFGVDDLRVGAPVELVTETLERIDGEDRSVWKWRPIVAAGTGSPR
jgi:uncharacterized OB-fold protein